MSKNKNPFAVRKSPVELISAQAVTLDDYVAKLGCRPAETGICLSGQD